MSTRLIRTICGLFHCAAGELNGPARKAFKKQLIRLSWQRGYQTKQTWQLIRFLDWVMRLPENLEQELRQELAAEEESLMQQYVTSWERLAKEEGKLEALRVALQEILKLRFQSVPPDLLETVDNITDLERLQQLHRAAVLCPQLETFTAQLALAE